MTCRNRPLPEALLTTVVEALPRKSSITTGKMLQLAILLGSSLVFGGSVMAQPAVATAKPAISPAANASKAVSVELTQLKVIKDSKGAEQLVAAPTVVPGDVIEYRATYKNNSTKSIAGLVADLPIPEGLEYLPKSAKPGAALVKVATKNGDYLGEPLMRKLPDNKTEPVPYNEYRALRWSLGQLPAGGVTAVTARARVETVVPPAPKVVPVSAQSSVITVKPASATR